MILIEIHGADAKTAKKIREKIRGLLTNKDYYRSIAIETYPTEVIGCFDIARSYINLKIPGANIPHTDVLGLIDILRKIKDERMVSNVRFTIDTSFD